MDIKQLKTYLYENQDKLRFVLEECGFHHIKKHSGSGDDYLTMGNVDGDNQTAITLYLSESLMSINYTREMCSDKNSCDVIDLICFARQEGLFHCLKWISETSGINYYENFKSDLPESIRIIKKLKEMLSKVDNDGNEEDNTPIKIKDPNILSYYYPYANQMFEDDGISVGTQAEFQIGYDIYTNRITIPIFDELNNLVGVKGRYFEREVPSNELKKYYYLETCPRHRILYGYNFTKGFINEKKQVIVHEAEKSVLQAWSYGYKNSIATMGKRVSMGQIDKLNRLGCEILLAFDEDVKEEELRAIAEKFSYGVSVFALIDRDGILGKKQSPTDDRVLFEKLMNEYKVELK